MSALDMAVSLMTTFAERGRVVREVSDPAIRQLLVYDHRLIYRVHDDRDIACIEGASAYRLAGGC